MLTNPSNPDWYNDWFTSTPNGTTQNFDFGSLQRTSQGGLFTNNDGSQHYFTPQTDVNTVAGYDPGIANAWNQAYGFSPTTSGAHAPVDLSNNPTHHAPSANPVATKGDNGTANGTGINFFQPDLFSSSSSQNGSFSGSNSGINWDSPFMQALMPQLQSSIQAMPGLLDNYQQTVQDQQANLARTALGPEAFQGTMNDLASRGMLNSSVASDAISKAAQNIMQQVLTNGFQASTDALTNKLNYPTALGRLAQLGQEGSSFGFSFGQSQSSDPLQPYQLASNMIMGMQ